MIERHAQLEALYALVPSTICENCGECCELTDEDMKLGYATMYPLFAVEYTYITEYVIRTLNESDQRWIFGVLEERPRRCPFRDHEQGRCIIYPVRPMACRSYGVLSSEEVDDAERRYRGVIPDAWLDWFLRLQESTICSNVQVVEPEKIARHTENLVAHRYTRKLIELSQGFDLFGEERRRILERITGQSELVVWTWGRYNALRSRSSAWMESDLGNLWWSMQMTSEGQGG